MLHNLDINTQNCIDETPLLKVISYSELITDVRVEAVDTIGESENTDENF